MPRSYRARTTTLSDDDRMMLSCSRCDCNVIVSGKQLETMHYASRVLRCAKCETLEDETTELVKRTRVYDFYIITCHNGRKLYNIVPRGSKPPYGGYGRKSWIESVKGETFGEAKTVLASMGETRPI